MYYPVHIEYISLFYISGGVNSSLAAKIKFLQQNLDSIPIQHLASKYV